MNNKILLTNNDLFKEYEINLPGSKSFTNRALILAALKNYKISFSNFSDSNDSLVVISALEKLGKSIKFINNTLKIEGTLKAYKGTIDIKEAGTSSRFLTSLISFIPGSKVLLTGEGRILERPIDDLVDTLRKLGADIKYIEKKGSLPLMIKGVDKPKQDFCEIDISKSSQFFSSIALVLPSLMDNFKLIINSELTSNSYIEMTNDVIKKFGFKIIKKDGYNYEYIKLDKKIKNFTVEGDASGASYFLSHAFLSESTCRINNLNLNSTQGDIQYIKILESLGAKIKNSDLNNYTELTGIKSFKGIPEINMELMPDTAQSLAVVLSLADTESNISGLKTLKIKETDRIEAIKKELSKIGITSQTTNKSIKIIPSKINNNFNCDTYSDHRMAMSMAIYSAKFNNIQINNPIVVGKSYPSFWTHLEKTGVKCKYL